MAAALGGMPAPVVPISICWIPSPLYAVLRGYKAAPVAEARDRFRRIVGEVLAGFLARHAACLGVAAGGPLHLAVAVPPTSRPGPPPLHRVPGIGLTPGLLERHDGALGHLQASPRGFAVPPTARVAVEGRRILLVDDAYTTGARAQSAATALHGAGAAAVVVVPVGRVVRRGSPEDRLPYRLAAARAEKVGRGLCPVPGCSDRLCQDVVGSPVTSRDARTSAC